MLNNSLLFTAFASFLIGLGAIGAVRRVALAVGFVDHPDRRRKLHETPIAYGGGIAVWLAAWGGWGISRLAGWPGTREAGDAGWFCVALAIASLVMLGVGVIDDRYGLRGRHKLAGQIVAAMILVGLGLRVDVWSGFGVEINLGIFAFPVNVLWILLVVNAFNLIDGMDGFCGSLSLVAAVAIALLAHAAGHVEDTILALTLAGALAAFLTFNLPPARLYLGDAGSMMIGLMLAALSLRACSGGPNTAVAFPPLVALLILPLLDVVTALGRRWLTGRSLFTTDRGHLHHRLSSRLGSTALALAAAIGLATLGAIGAALTKAYGLGDRMAALAAISSICLLIGTNTFGGSESRLLVIRIKRVLSTVLTGRSARLAHQQECHFYGVRDWAGVWTALIREAEGRGISRIELAIDMTAEGEVYHALWSAPNAPEDGPCWSLVHTLRAGGVPAGILRIAGSVDARQSRYLAKVEQLVRGLEGRLASDVPPPAPSGIPLPAYMKYAPRRAPKVRSAAPPRSAPTGRGRSTTSSRLNSAPST